MRLGFFRKKRFLVTAIQWNGLNTPEVMEWLGVEYTLFDDQPHKYFLVRWNLGGLCIAAEKGDWFVEEEGHLRVVKGEEFPLKYDTIEPPVQEPSPVEVRQESTVSHD